MDCIALIFTTLWANVVDNKLMIFFLIFSSKHDLISHTNCLSFDYFFF